MRKELFAGLSEEQINKVMNCKSAEEVLALARAENMELNDEQLEAVSGGACDPDAFNCPKCGSNNYTQTGTVGQYHCNNCNTDYDLYDIKDQIEKSLNRPGMGMGMGAVQ